MLGVGQSRLQRTKSRFQGKDERWLRGKGRAIFLGFVSLLIATQLTHKDMTFNLMVS